MLEMRFWKRCNGVRVTANASYTKNVDGSEYATWGYILIAMDKRESYSTIKLTRISVMNT